MSDTQVEFEPTQPPTATQPRTRRSPGFPWERSPLAQFTVEELLAEVDARRAGAAKLVAERDRILTQLADIEAELAAAGITVSGPTTPTAARPAGEVRQARARNSVSLADALALAIEVRAVVSPSEAAQLVQSNGYRSTAKSFGMIVANALSKDARFMRVGRGRYERVEAASAAHRTGGPG